MFSKNAILASAGALLLSACNNASDKSASTDSTKMEQTIGTHEGHEGQATHGEAHVYSCPMHPEFRQDKPGECPKCGMELEHTDAAANMRKYGMAFTVEPRNPAAGQPVLLSLKPFDPEDKSAQVPLDVQHEKKIHLIIASRDLSYFDHIHPEYQANGSYTVRHTFPKDDNYVLFADFKATGGAHTTEKQEVVVGSGKEGDTKYTTQLLTKSVDGFEVSLVNESGKPFGAGEQVHIEAVIMRDGKEVSAESLEDYLGAKAHMVVIRQSYLDYLHVHPGIERGRLDLHTTFDQAGTYRGWLQFQTEGKVHTADFVILLKAAA